MGIKNTGPGLQDPSLSWQQAPERRLPFLLTHHGPGELISGSAVPEDDDWEV